VLLIIRRKYTSVFEYSYIVNVKYLGIFKNILDRDMDITISLIYCNALKNNDIYKMMWKCTLFFDAMV
tara:strand:- start:228894 stop:229097 length:204 start_codon:yes stop_codon:yes gene_type:complete